MASPVLDHETEETLHLGASHGLPFGAITGVLFSDPTTKTPKCLRFTGIPYAQPPVGTLRWEKPKPLDPVTIPSKPTLRATQMPSVCPQPPIPPIIQSSVSAEREYSEDCLQLNIWRPPGSAPDGGWPVFVYLHGGFLQWGDANYGNHHDFTELIAAHSARCIFVTPMYRLSVLGFLCIPDADHSNFGLWDQRAAIEWTHQHIAAFGGNPKSIGVGGYSAGSLSAFLQMQYDLRQPYDERIIRRVALQSNCPVSCLAPTSEETSLKYKQFCQGCDVPEGLSHEDTLKFLRQVDCQSLFAALAEVSDPVFRAVVDEDFILSSMINDLYDGSLAKAMAEGQVSLLIGSTEREEAVYGAMAPDSRDGVVEALQRVFPEHVVSAALPFYVPLGQQDVDWQKLYGQVFADLQVRIGGIGLASQLPAGLVYRYEVQWRAAAVARFLPMELGVTHGSDTQLVWFGANKLLQQAEMDVVGRWVAPWVSWLQGDQVAARSQWGSEGVALCRVLQPNGQIDSIMDNVGQRLAIWNAIKAASLKRATSLL